jgi:transcriptional antiterminator RfaH
MNWALRGTGMQSWFLAQVKPNADQIARRNLERQGFTIFQPMERRTAVRRGKLVEQVRPFFSGYLFVTYPSASAPWSLVNSTYGVSRLVKTGDRPAEVPPEVVANLFKACDEDGVIIAAPAVSVGDRVEVMRGALTNFVGQIQRLTPDERAIVLLDIIGKQTKVMVPTVFLRAASGRTKQPG